MMRRRDVVDRLSTRLGRLTPRSYAVPTLCVFARARGGGVVVTQVDREPSDHVSARGCVVRSSCSGGRWGEETDRNTNWPGYPFPDDSWSMEFHFGDPPRRLRHLHTELMLRVAIGECCPSKRLDALPIASSTGRRPWTSLSPSDKCLTNGRWLCVVRRPLYAYRRLQRAPLV
jgi:hypothetical protein